MIRMRLGLGFLALAVACGGAQPETKAPPAPAPADGGAQAVARAEGTSDHDKAAVPISANDPSWGSKTALVTVVEFSDFQCPFCSRVEPTLSQLKSDYGPEKLRIVWKNEPLPFHQNARSAAEAAAGVFALGGNDAFWRFHDAAFANQQMLGSEAYEKWAAAAGVDAARFRAGMAAHEWAPKVDADREVAHAVGVNGTPAFFINGTELSGAQPLAKFKALVDVELEKAMALVAAGLPRENVYTALTNANIANRPPAEPDDEEDEPEDTTTVFKVRLGNAPVRGSKDALVTIVEFADFQCPFCKRSEETLTKVREKYGKDVRFVWKNEPLPFHPRAVPAAQLALEARAEKGDAAFWAIHDKLLAEQAHLDDADLESYAKDAGLDVAKVKAAIAKKKYEAQLESDTNEADDVMASGTPHFFINGRRLVGAQPMEKFEKIIDEELVKAKALVAKGTAPAAVYDALTKDGKTAPPPEKKAVTLAANAPERGAKSAKVVVQMFSDFQCPFCKRVEPTVDALLKAYPNRVKIVWRNMPLPMHPDAPLAAEAAMEAFAQKGAAGFWKMHDLLFENQAKPDGLKRDALLAYGKEVGLDGAKLAAALDGETHKAEIEADVKAANDAGISGTPGFVINGYFLGGAYPLPKFKKLVDLALAEGNAPAKAK